MSDVLTRVRAHLQDHFTRMGITSEPVEASVTFIGAEPIGVVRFEVPDRADSRAAHYVSLGCSRRPMVDPAELLADPVLGPRAEIAVTLRGPSPRGLARSVAVVAAAPSVEGVILEPDALVDLEAPLWQGAPFTAYLLGRSEIGDVVLPEPLSPVSVLSAVPITAREAAWVRLRGAGSIREAWVHDGVDPTDPLRRAANPA